MNTLNQYIERVNSKSILLRELSSWEKHPLAGKLYCGGCGYSLNYKPLRGKNRYRRFECRKHSLLQIPECCTYIRADILEETVLLMLKKELLLRGNTMRQTRYPAPFQKHIEELTQGVVDTFIKKVYAYKGKRVEIEWNFRMDCGNSLPGQ